MDYLSKFLFVISAQKIKLLLIVTLFITISLLDAIGIGLIGPFIGLAVKPEAIQGNVWLSSIYGYLKLNNTNQFIAFLGLTVVILFYFKSFLYYQIQSYVLKFCYTQQVWLRLRMLHTYLSLPYTFYLKTNSAHVIQSISGESANFTYSIAIPLLNSIANLFVLVVLLLLMAKTDLLATVSILGLLLVVVVPFHYFRHKVAAWGKDGVEANTETIRVVNHAIGGLKTTKLIGCESFFENQLLAQSNKYARAASLFHSFQQLPRIVIETLLITFVVGFVSLSLIIVERSDSLVSVLGIFAIASVRIIPSASQLLTCMGVLRNNKPTLDRLYLDLKELEAPESLNYLKMSGNKTNAISNNRVHAFTDKLVIDQLNYSYPGAARQALKNVSLTIRKGESIALIGTSGAGKTTLSDVFLGLLIPQSGDIKVDGVSVYSDLRAWQNLIGYIPQSIFLMDDTIERNIAFGLPDEQIDQQKLDQAIKTAQLSELIEQLPEGVHTFVGENGVRLSGGQRQRIGIARALYYEREILVLDEATSALDNETESLISEALRELGRTKTMIVIAHRLTTVEHCDRIYEMSNGEIVRSGSYQEIVVEGKKYED
ncbi:ABC transporter ATP-binding protein [Pseudanabaena sp. ABRG5-3]|uniref:ABC transporter ATP-binding protein n=1 Tax=Pseudanabaena sp. ABRG5-3 TaxID=685565 RepID=UPI000DC7046C|nr:ABC transporter ATP-binding protein/permease [Pseudanabaena sp. ABRG5-3]BBC24291.1 ABC transporter-like protein [Pseudanabaena sp. ABRG5-3]